MEEKERRMKLKRERREYGGDVHMKSFAGHALEPYYVRPGDADDDVFQRAADRSAAASAAAQSAAELSAAADSASFVPLLLVGFAFMAAYIGCGAAVLYRLDGGGGRTYLDCVFFCFMLLSTIGFGNAPRPLDVVTLTGTATVWFCSVYILSGMALTAMCFNIVHHGVSTKLRTFYQPAAAAAVSANHTDQSGAGSVSDLTSLARSSAADS